MKKANVVCGHCGCSWFHEGKTPAFCINCYSRDVRDVPSPIGEKIEALQERMRKQKRMKEKMKGVTRLK